LFNLCNTYDGSSKIKSSYRDTYNRQYQTFSKKPGESLDDCFARFESIVIVYVLVVLLHIPIINVLSSCYMRLIIMYDA
jgi:hypothetical protein